MSGDTEKASVWADADVYTSLDLAAPIPADASTAFSAAWDLAGLLDGTDGFEYSRDEDVTDHYAWGGILVATSRKNFKQTVKLSVLEDNDTTRALIWPGSTASALYVPKPPKIKLGLETRSGGKVKRMVTKNYAQISLDGSYKDGEDELTKYPLLATIYPDATGQLWVPLNVPQISSIAVTPDPEGLTVGSIERLVATATYADTTTGDVTDQCRWVSSDTAVATVDRGYITGVSAGTSNITASIGVVSDTVVATVS